MGAGTGAISCYAAAQGATRVVALEPQLAGRVRHSGRITARAADYPVIEVRSDTLQSFESSHPFDVVLVINTINHLDEAAVTLLHQDEGARDRYRVLLYKLYRLLAPHGLLVLADCARSNLWAPRSPFKPRIEWHKHQNPSLWADLLHDVGFYLTRYWWTPPRALRFLPWNGVAAYLTNSYFTLHTSRP